LYLKLSWVLCYDLGIGQGIRAARGARARKTQTLIKLFYYCFSSYAP
jgi:hypothetical protein